MLISKTDRILIIGQHLTSRTEAVRDYLLNRVDAVAVIGLGSVFINKKENKAFYYEKGILTKSFTFKHGFLNVISKTGFLIPAAFLFYLVDIFRSLLIFRKRFDCFIGISHFSGVLAVLLKLSGMCKRTVYYAIDYYAPGVNRPFLEKIMLKIENTADKIAVSNANEIWDISARIEEGRRKFSKIETKKYTKNIVPLGYAPEFFRYKGMPEIDRFSLVFVGVVIDEQGLDLVLEAMPVLNKLMPEIKVKIIGTGPYLPKLKAEVSAAKFENLFKFYGFIESTEEMLNIVASSAVGVSLWDNRNNKILNAHHGDPGKTKLYSVCGLPVIVSNFTVYSGIIQQSKAGVAIDYNLAAFINAVKELLLDDNRYLIYKDNAIKAGREYCSSENIFNSVFSYN